MSAVAHVMDDLDSIKLSIAGQEVAREGEAGDGETVRLIEAALERRIGSARYDLWFDRKTRMVLAGDTLVVRAANAFAGNWIRGKFAGELGEASAEVLHQAMKVEVRVDASSAAVDAGAVGRANTGGGSGVAEAIVRSGGAAAGGVGAAAAVHLKYTLEEFVVGPSNQLAYHAAMQVAQRPGEEFNPLFLHGHCGLGKTHLLQGICQRFVRLNPGKKWMYLTGEQFTNEFLEALKGHRTEGFRKRIRNTDLLVIDDVHFLANKKATQEEFLHTFNQVDAGGKQIVLASDCAPKQIAALSEGLTSRFVSGMVLRIDAPDLPTRLEILRRRVARNGWKVGDAVLMHIAQSATSSVRELEGMLLQVMAGMRLMDAGAADAGEVMAQIKDRTAMRGHGGGPVAVEKIVAAVAEHFGLLAGALMGASREKTTCTARAIAMHLARQHTGMSFPELGRAFGGKNHSTVIAACQRVEAMVAGGELLCWNMPDGAKHQAIADVIHDLEATIRRTR